MYNIQNIKIIKQKIFRFIYFSACCIKIALQWKYPFWQFRKNSIIHTRFSQKLLEKYESLLQNILQQTVTKFEDVDFSQ